MSDMTAAPIQRQLSHLASAHMVAGTEIFGKTIRDIALDAIKHINTLEQNAMSRIDAMEQKIRELEDIGQPKMTKHSEGPWTVGPYDENYAAISAKPWGVLATVTIRNCGKADPEGEANARLIAAAPDLYAALQEFKKDHAHRLPACAVPSCVLCKKINEFLERVDAALTKAEKRK